MPIELSAVQIAFLVLIGLILVFLAVFFYYLKRHVYHKGHVIPRTMDWVFLEIQMPKENAEEKEQQRVKTEEEKKHLIAVGEQLFTTLSESGHSKGWLKGKDYYSFEIACTDKKISFFINCPKHLQQLVEKQLQAQYPHAFVEQVRGYNPFQKDGSVEVQELQLSKQYVYPFRTYKNTETDPLNALTNAMSKLFENEGAAIQYVIAPAGTSWQGAPRRMALEVQQGKNPELIERGHLGRFFVGFRRFFASVITGTAGKGQSTGSHIHKDLSGYAAPIQLTPMQQEIVKRLEEKASRPGYKANVRLITSSSIPGNAKSHMHNLMAAFLQFNMPPFNGLRVRKRNRDEILKDYIFRVFRDYGKTNIINTEEMCSLWHLPTPYIETPNIKWLISKKAPPPINIHKQGLLVGKNIYRNLETPIYMGREDRRRHTYILGRTGSGKSVLLSNMAIQDIKNGEGLCVIDPHGDLIQDILVNCPKSRAEDIIVLEPFDMDRPLGLNMLEVDSEEQKDFAVQEMISIFYKLVTDPAMLGPMFEHNMRNAMLTLMADEEHPGTITDIPRIFTDTEFQRYKLSKVKDPVVRLFWEKEMAKTSDFHKSEMLGYLISKVGRFVENTMMRNIVGQSKSGFNFRKVMDEGKVLLVNLSKGRTGEINAKLLGLILVSKIQIAALSRADIPEEKRKDFYLYVDEFQNFITDAFSSILSEARKYKLNLIMAHQYLGQLEQQAGAQGAASKDLRDAVFGNVGTMIVFRTGAEDSEVLGKEFAPTFNQFDLVNIDRYNAYVRLMVDGTASKPFNMATMPPKREGSEEIAQAIRQLSRLKYGRSRAEVEAEILEASEVAENMSEALPSVERGL
ncbi:MAG: type IV secretory system conjugative DNA transfer family protein [Candidatus Doudnabacteria bacterium]|nr:type IV secretory system conjugative DNA transfer family protein [Candidatus Doudnabacteria bacterium]